MKIAGIILIVLQIIGVIGAFIGGKNPFSGNFLEIIGYFLTGIIGVILLIADYIKNNRE